MYFIGEGEYFTVAIKLDRFLRTVVDRVAMIAKRQMSFEGFLQAFIQFAVQIPANFLDGIVAIHLVPSLESFAEFLA